MILTSYFTTRKHPQHLDPNTIGVQGDGHVPNNDFNYIKTWYESVKDSGHRGFIFHDNLSYEFVDKYTSDKIEFIRVKHPNEFSLNDVRFFHYQEWVCSFPDLTGENIFMTDIADVKVNKPPVESVDLFCVGSDNGRLNDYSSPYGGNYFHLHKYFNLPDIVDFSVNNYPLINAGVLGGKYDLATDFLNKYCETRNLCRRPELNINMALVNFAVRSLWGYDIQFGDPVTSEFKKYQNDREDVWFIHK